MIRFWGRPHRIGSVLICLLALVLPRVASALPSYAAQTGAACSQCHTVAFGPALTPFGQQFKLNGYSWGTWDSYQPVAGMLVASFNNTQQGQPGGAAPHFSANN